MNVGGNTAAMKSWAPAEWFTFTRHCFPLPHLPRLLSPVFHLLSLVSRLSSLISHLPSPVSCLSSPSPISSLPSLVSLLSSLVSRLPFPVSFLPSLVSLVPSLVSLLPSLVFPHHFPLPALPISPWNTYSREEGCKSITAGWEGARLAASRGGGWLQSGEGWIWPPVGGVEDDRWVGRGEVGRQQGWRMTAGRGRGNLTARRGGSEM